MVFRDGLVALRAREAALQKTLEEERGRTEGASAERDRLRSELAAVRRELSWRRLTSGPARGLSLLLAILVVAGIGGLTQLLERDPRPDPGTPGRATPTSSERRPTELPASIDGVRSCLTDNDCRSEGPSPYVGGRCVGGFCAPPRVPIEVPTERRKAPQTPVPLDGPTLPPAGSRE